MTDPKRSDALVFFGATGDLAYKQIFPALQAMIRKGGLDVPIIGVAKSGWDLEQLRARARDSLEHHGGLERGAFDKLSSLLRYVDGDYAAGSTFEALRRELGDAKRPLHYLADPPERVRRGGRAASPSRDVPRRRASSWRSHSGTTSPPRALSTRRSTMSSRSPRSSASTTTSARSRS